MHTILNNFDTAVHDFLLQRQAVIILHLLVLRSLSLHMISVISFFFVFTRLGHRQSRLPLFCISTKSAMYPRQDGLHLALHFIAVNSGVLVCNVSLYCCRKEKESNKTKKRNRKEQCSSLMCICRNASGKASLGFTWTLWMSTWISRSSRSC